MLKHGFAFGPFALDIEHGILMRDGRRVDLGHKGLLLLQALVNAHGQTVSKSELMDAAWPGTAVEDSNLSVQIAALRKLLGPSPSGGDWITTIPRTGYRFSGASNAAGVSPASGSAEPERRPSIVVLPFGNISGDDAQDYLADGITEDIIIALARFRWFSVIARNSSFAYKGKSIDSRQIAEDLNVRYLLEGSVRKSGQRLRISAQLIDARTGNHIWAERYDLELTEVFAIQDEIAERVVGAAEPELLRTEGIAGAALHTGNMTAWDLVRRGTWEFHRVGRESHLRARDLFREACRLDPGLPEAHIWCARVSAGIVAYAWSANPSDDIREGMDASFKAIQLDEKNPYSHYALAITSVYANVLEQARSAAERAVEINPSFALGHLVLGMANFFDGRAAEAVAPLNRGLQLSPHDPQNFVWLNLLALAHLFTRQTKSALDAGLRALKIRPNWGPTLESLACCFGALGKWDDARRCVREMRDLKTPQIDVLAPLKLRNPRWNERMLSMLRKAGFESQP